MFLSKIKASIVVVLMVAVLGGAGIGAYYLHAQTPTPKTEEPLKNPGEGAPKKKTVDKPEDRLHKLLEERLKAAEQEWKVRWELYRIGANEPGTGNPVTLHLLMDIAKRLLKSELELSENKVARLKAREKYLKLAKDYVDITERQYKAGRVSAAAFASARYEQLDAEIELEREKAR